MKKEMNVQKFIQDNGWEALQSQLGICVKEYDCGVVVLNYDQIESPRNHPIADECRALKLDKRTLKVLSRSFERFYNYGECDTVSTFDWSNVGVFEKADGSLIGVYWCPNTDRWEISTRGTAFAESRHSTGEESFRVWVLRAMGYTEDRLQEVFSNMPITHTYIFEYTGPENRIVTRYEKSMMVMLAVICNELGYESTYHDLMNWVARFRDEYDMNVRLPRVYNMQNPDECVAAIAKLGPLEEGYVVVDLNTNKRVKIKSPAYLAIHKMRGNGAMTFNNMSELVLMNEHEEYLVTFEEDRPLFVPIIEALDDLTTTITTFYDSVKSIEDQKEFALKVKDQMFSGVLFRARKEKCTAAHAFNQSSMKARQDILRRFMNVTQNDAIE